MTGQRRAEGSFVIVVIVATIVAGIAIYGSHKAREASSENRVLIHQVADQAVRIGQLQRTQRDSCKNYETLRAAVNVFHGTIKAFLKTAEQARAASARTAPTVAERAMNRRVARTYARLIANTHLVTATCAQKRE